MKRLSIRARAFVTAAALFLIAAQFLPLWKIDLHAPQYPEGIGMLIRMDTLTGIKPADLDNLNGLNHYIGMQAIHADSFPALDIMPWVVGALAAMALVVAFAGRRALLIAWLGMVAVAGLAGFAEFYRWTYRYGHDLAPDAIIKVPGMTYQPPILGTKQLLNFTATSWPDIGGWLAVAAFLLGVAALFPLARRSRTSSVVVTSVARAVSGTLTVVLLLIVACTPSAAPTIAYGKADCDVCHMRIVDPRYGGLAVTAKGKTNQFDSIECLANYSLGVTALRSIWVADFDHPGTLVDVVTARFIRKNGPTAEMGANILAFESRADTLLLRQRFGAGVLSWSDVQQLAERNELREAPVQSGVVTDAAGVEHRDDR